MKRYQKGVKMYTFGGKMCNLCNWSGGKGKWLGLSGMWFVGQGGMVV